MVPAMVMLLHCAEIVVPGMVPVIMLFAIAPTPALTHKFICQVGTLLRLAAGDDPPKIALVGQHPDCTTT